MAEGVIAGIWGWGPVYCLFNVRNVDPFWLMRCNDCRSPCMVRGYLDDVNDLNYVVNILKQKLLMTTLAAGLFFEGSYLRPSGLKCGTIFQSILRKCPCKPRKSVNDPWLVSKWGSQGKKASLCWGRGKEKPQVFLCENGK